MRITILQRPDATPPEDFADELERALSSLKDKLSASTRLIRFSSEGWAVVDVAGSDEEVLIELVRRQFGQAQTDLSEIALHGNYDGIINGCSDDSLEVDIGIERPEQLNLNVKLTALRAQLADGKPLSLGEIVEHYCLHEGTKVSIRVTCLDTREGTLEGWLADAQIEQFSTWIRTGLDRVQVFNCSRRAVESAIRRANLWRDIISVDSLTLTTHSLLCKLGTDAIGLIPKLGSVLRKQQLKPFLPKRIVSRCRRW